jgi:HD-like signal output (HDOD) protein
MIAEIHPHIGSLVLNAWNFPAELIDVPVHALDFSRTHDASADYADLVTVAIVQLNYEGAAIDRSGITAFSKLGISPDIEIMEMPMLQDGYEQSLEMLGA